jgi:1-acyl-sn-glycerol-3-phosphate acyltransferase
MKAMTSLMSSLSVFTSTLAYLQRARHLDDVELLKRQWAFELLGRMGVTVNTVGEPATDRGLLLIGNHISYLDIAMLLGVAPHISFVSKKEIASWPVIGLGAKKLNTIFVERESQDSRKVARETISGEIRKGARIVLFPSGTTCMMESKPWKRGAFEIARDLKVPIQPFRIRYTPMRKAAFIAGDMFPVHLFQLAQTGGVQAHIEFHPPVMVQDAQESCTQWQEWSRPTNETEGFVSVNFANSNGTVSVV